MSSNPFATRFIRPGALGYIFPPEASAESLVQRLRQNCWCGQIVGPHGSGKSTLLAALVPALEAIRRKVIQVQIQGRGSSQTSGVKDQVAKIVSPDALHARSQLIIDGYEQLSWLVRRKIKQQCWSRGAGLLVTTHEDLRDTWLPTLACTEPTLELARAVVARLLPAGDTSITDEHVAAAYAATQGNIRETLFSLFDVYQRRNTSNPEG